MKQRKPRRVTGKSTSSIMRKLISLSKVYRNSSLIKRRKPHRNYTMIDPTVPSKEFFLVSDDIRAHLFSKITQAKLEASEEIFSRNVNVLVSDHKEFFSFLRGNWPHNDQFLVYQTDNHSGFAVWKDLNNILEFSVSTNSARFNVYGSSDFCDEIIEFILDKFEESTCNLEWIYSADGSSTTVVLRGDRNPISEMYSFLGDEDLHSYYDRFMKSTASILVLIGKPGTGKTSFIRGLLQHTKADAMVTYDMAVMGKDFIFAQFIEGDASVFVIEDADTLLKARSDGNDLMARFLAVGDGLVTTAGKKMIFSTNLPSIRDIDPALIRKGRCFGVLNFESLNTAQANKLCDKLMISKPSHTKSETFTLAEIFNRDDVISPNSKSATSKVGFF